MGLYKRNGVFYGRVKNDSGAWVSKTLNTSDRVVARERYRELERREAIPSYRAANETTWRDAVREFVTSRQVKGCADGTMQMYEVKLRHLTSFFGECLPLARIDAPKVDKYIVRRLEVGASRNTIGKELTSLRGVLKIARRAGKFNRSLDEVLPTEWANDYEPRKTALTPVQVEQLVTTLASPATWVDKLGREYERDDGNRVNRAACAAFMVATGARKGEALRATRGQIDLARGLVYFEITKTRRKGKREKYVPITPMTRPLLEQVLAATAGRSGAMFDRWGNIIRDLRLASETAGIPRVTPNDLRRTHANWLRGAGVDLASIADVLGHVDSRMVEKVYGKLRPEQLRDRVVAAVGMH